MAEKDLYCFVVCERFNQKEPIFWAIEATSSAAYRRAKEFILGYNARQKTSHAVLRKGTARMEWEMN